MKKSLVLKQKHREHQTVWHLQGDLVVEETASLREVFYQWVEDNRVRVLVMDMLQLNRIDAAGISLLISFQNVMNKRKKTLKIRRVPQRVYALFARTSLNLYFDIKK
ncbi:MAG: hypothetical protein CR997_12250 [Acidobacteria bacterium]|nr:MAG: hypothetical protein CR997_12250 [Acidobacteriota bacterium]